MTNYPDELWMAIASVLTGNATSDEKKWVDNWLNESEKNRSVFAHLSKLGYNGTLEKAELVKERIFETVQKKIEVKHYKSILRIWQYVAAASVAMLLLLGGTFFIWTKTSWAIASIETKIPKGVKSKIVLSDGTVVYLNSGTYLKYPAQFKGGMREVFLIGEGYFEVTKDSKHPFIVNADGFKIKVLGTHFNVKNYSDDYQIVATLLEGKICVSKSINNDNNLIELKPNEQVTLNRSSGKMDKLTVQANLFTNWRENKYYFDGKNLEEISKELERGFNIKILILSENLKKEIFTGLFDKGETITEILDIIKSHRLFTYELYGNTIKIFEK